VEKELEDRCAWMLRELNLSKQKLQEVDQMQAFVKNAESLRLESEQKLQQYG
jgi:hypothetical protein